jgi:hypothetical protein
MKAIYVWMKYMGRCKLLKTHQSVTKERWTRSRAFRCALEHNASAAQRHTPCMGCKRCHWLGIFRGQDYKSQKVRSGMCSALVVGRHTVF